MLVDKNALKKFWKILHQVFLLLTFLLLYHKISIAPTDYKTNAHTPTHELTYLQQS